MTDAIRRLLAVIDAFLDGAGRDSEPPLQEKTLSFRLFGDSKTIGLLRDGSDMTTKRLENALEWMSDRWPAAAVWPAHVERPCHERGEAA